MNDFKSQDTDEKEEIELQPLLEEKEGNKVDKKDNLEESFGCISSVVFIVILSLFTGLYSVMSLGLFMYQKDELGLKPKTIQMITGIVDIPWLSKPIFGYFMDVSIRKIKKTKYFIMVMAVIKLIILLVISFCNVGLGLLIFLMFVFQVTACLESIISEYLLVLLSQEYNKGSDKTHNELPVYYIFRSIGMLIGSFSGGRIIKKYDNQTAFQIASILPVLTFIVAILFKEKPRANSDVHYGSFTQEITKILQICKIDKVSNLIAFAMLINSAPDFSALVTFYLTDKLKFSTDELANLETFATLCYIIGLVIYYQLLTNTPPRKFFFVANFIAWLIGLSFLLIVLDVYQSLGWNPKHFCYVSGGMSSFMAELQIMPILTIWITLIPKNLEAVSISLITSLQNLSGISSEYTGAFFMWILNIENENYDKLWILVLIQNFYFLFILIILLFVDLPEPKPKTKNDNPRPNELD